MEVYIQKLKKYLKIDAVRIAGANGETAVVFTGYDVTKRVENEKNCIVWHFLISNLILI